MLRRVLLFLVLFIPTVLLTNVVLLHYSRPMAVQAQEDRTLYQVSPSQAPQISRLVDSAHAINCYLYIRNGTFVCTPWGQR